MGIELDNTILYTLQFANDLVIILNDKKGMEYKLIEEYEIWGLKVNIQKIEFLLSMEKLVI